MLPPHGGITEVLGKCLSTRGAFLGGGALGLPGAGPGPGPGLGLGLGLSGPGLGWAWACLGLAWIWVWASARACLAPAPGLGLGQKTLSYQRKFYVFTKKHCFCVVKQ